MIDGWYVWYMESIFIEEIKAFLFGKNKPLILNHDIRVKVTLGWAEYIPAIRALILIDHIS